ncbi:MAG: Inositol-phosphate phosphatase [Candidatus Saccharibacteria bacterium]|nr:Inositol-phosphate phosphatase [Candidatus Saccharibacteria bacterium]
MNEYLEFAKDLAKEAGSIMYENFLTNPAKEWKEDRTPLTFTDTQINRLVIERISASFPDHSVLGEEESHNLGGEMTWVCDPVDGTMAFSHGLPISTFSLALTRAGKPIVGVVYDPYIKRLFWASKGEGAFLNGDQIHVSQSESLENTLIDLEAIGESGQPVIKLKPDFLPALTALGANSTRLWSVILPSVLVASGQFSATLFVHTKPEDGASIKIIVEEAGGKVTDLFGREQRYDQPTNGFLASNGKIHQQLLNLIAEYTVDK